MYNHDSSSANPWFLKKHFDWKDVFKNAPLRTVPKGKTLIMQGINVNEVFYIQSGRIRFSVFNNQGVEKTIFILDEGNIFGDVLSYNRTPSPVFAITNTECVFRCLSFEEFLRAVLSDIKYARTWISNLSFTIEYLINHIKDISFFDSYKLVANYLYKLCLGYGIKTKNGFKINMTFTQQEMAELIGCTRVTVSKVMAHMKDTGLIDKIDNYVYIKDIKKLKDISSI